MLLTTEPFFQPQGFLLTLSLQTISCTEHKSMEKCLRVMNSYALSTWVPCLAFINAGKSQNSYLWHSGPLPFPASLHVSYFSFLLDPGMCPTQPSFSLIICLFRTFHINTQMEYMSFWFFKRYSFTLCVCKPEINVRCLPLSYFLR